jgi:hypothetical protein
MDRLQLVIAKPRPFVRTKTFFGPDRRRKDSSFYRGPKRREDDGGTIEIDDVEGAA